MILSLRNLSAIVWLNYDFETFNATNEYDLTVQYGDKWGPAGLLLGYSYFTYPNRGWPDTEEVWIQGSYDIALNPIFSLHDDFRSGNGWYSSFGISHNIPLPVGTITPAALLYYHVHYYGGTGFPSVEFNLADTVTYRQISSSARVSYFRAL
ncbi:MAG: hypothetical protein HY200_04480, partial [Nitrospirae bacterium]|nr:hypothetical protein [Nitrospirota bacterium]